MTQNDKLEERLAGIDERLAVVEDILGETDGLGAETSRRVAQLALELARWWPTLKRLALEEERERMAHEAARAYTDEWVRGEER